MYLTLNGHCYAKGNSLLFSPDVKAETAFEVDDPESVRFLRRLVPLCTGTVAVERLAEELNLGRDELLHMIDGLLQLKVMSVVDHVPARVSIITQGLPHAALRPLTESPALQEFCHISDLAAVDSSVTLLVAADYEDNHPFFQDVHEKSLQYNIPWLKVSVQDMHLYMGPVFFSDGGPCYHCHLERLNLNRQEQQQSVIGHFGPPEGLLAPFLEREILKFVRNGGPSAVFERQVLINTYKLELSSYRVLKLPGCPECAKRA